MPYGKLTEVGDNSRVTYRSRKESDPIDRGLIPADALHGKVESIEISLDQIYSKMKTELRDVRDSLKPLQRYPEYALSPTPPTKISSSFPYAYPRSTDRVDV